MQTIFSLKAFIENVFAENYTVTINGPNYENVGVAGFISYLFGKKEEEINRLLMQQ